MAVVDRAGDRCRFAMPCTRSPQPPRRGVAPQAQLTASQHGLVEGSLSARKDDRDREQRSSQRSTARREAASLTRHDSVTANLDAPQRHSSPLSIPLWCTAEHARRGACPPRPLTLSLRHEHVTDKRRVTVTPSHAESGSRAIFSKSKHVARMGVSTLIRTPSSPHPPAPYGIHKARV